MSRDPYDDRYSDYDEPRRPRRYDDRYDDDYDDYDIRRYRDEYYDDIRYRRRRRYRRPLAQHRGPLILSIGIGAFFVCGIIFGPLAWAMGQHDLNEMRAGRMDASGESLTKAGRMCGIIALVVHVIAMILYFFLVVFVISELERQRLLR